MPKLEREEAQWDTTDNGLPISQMLLSKCGGHQLKIVMVHPAAYLHHLHMATARVPISTATFTGATLSDRLSIY